jgi:hypothetical protein
VRIASIAAAVQTAVGLVWLAFPSPADLGSRAIGVILAFVAAVAPQGKHHTRQD